MNRLLSMALLLTCGMIGCDQSPKITGVLTAIGQVEIKDVPADRPQFKRTYTLKLDDRATIELSYRTRHYVDDERFKSGTLTQPNGNSISFDPDRIAEKIIDPLLVPKVGAACAQIQALDDQFLKADPKEFTDESGTIWSKQ